MYDEENWRYIGHNKIIQLTYREKQILDYLIENKNRVVKYSELMALGHPSYPAVTRIINRLKKKLAGELEIKTRNSLGYYI